MASNENKGKPLNRRSTFQRMLQLEQKQKIDRMQASSPISLDSSISSGPPPRSLLRQSPAPVPLQSVSRAMTDPTLPLSITSPRPTNNATSPKHTVKFGGETYSREERSENGSDVSSICQSPGWEDYDGKRRRRAQEEKERRQKDKGSAAGQAQKVEQVQQVKQSESPMSHNPKRLSKAPPTNKHLSKLATTTDHQRSASAPAVPTLQTMARPEAKDGKKTIQEKAKRSSLEIGFKGFRSRKSSLNGSSSTTPTQESSSLRKSFFRAPTSYNDGGGFMGGLKLEQHIIRQQRGDEVEDGQVPSNSDKTSIPQRAGNLSTKIATAEPLRPSASIYDGSVRTPKEWDALYAQAASSTHSPTSPTHPVDDHTSIMERNIRKSGKYYPPSSRHFSMESGESSPVRRDTSSEHSGHSGVSSSRQNENKSTKEQQPAKDRPTRPCPETRGRSSFARYQQQESESKDGDSVGDGRKPRSRRNSLVEYIKSKSRSRSRNPGRETKPAANGPFRSEDDVLKQLHLELSTKATESTSAHNRSSSASAAGFLGLKSAAKTAFSRHSVGGPPESPTSQLFSAALDQNSSKASSHKHASLKPVPKGSPSARVDRFNIDSVAPPIVQDFALQPVPKFASEQRTGRWDASLEGPPLPAANGTNGRSNHTRSATDSSEGYSTLDEFSNVTTPMASRPTSQKGILATDGPFSNHKESFESKPTPDLVKTFIEIPAPTSPLPFEHVSSARDSWCSATAELELTRGVGRKSPALKSPALKNFAPEVIPAVPKVPTSEPFAGPAPVTSTAPSKQLHIGSLQREPSISRSFSTPDMQDLSFLPPLKHQALPPRAPKPGKEKPTSNMKVRKSPSPEERARKSLVRPPTLPVSHSATKPGGASPTSPHSSQYLQTARLSIPRAPQVPKTTFVPAPLDEHKNGPEPIAKMLVVCCSCNYFHDMPSKIYECMAKPDNVVTDRDLGVSGVISTSVKCPWCGHGMSTACCAGYAAVVYLTEKLH